MLPQSVIFMQIFAFNNLKKVLVCNRFMSLFSELNEFMVRYSFRPNPKLSQNFVVDEKTVQRIVEAAELKKTDLVLEIGSGTGFLTRELLKHCKKVIGIEKDKTLAELLRTEIKEKDFELLEGDALELDWPRFNKMVSLPPYGISSDLVYKLLEQGFEEAFLVFQREFAEKLLAEPGFLDYGCLSVWVQYQTEAKQEFLLSPNAFFPRPPGSSVLVRLKKKKRFGSAKNDAVFLLFLKQLFRHKNKSISNSLDLALPFLKKEFPLSHADCKKKAGKWRHWDEKVYALEIKWFVELFNALYS
jgi:16S rRNA (adenine1518-N6/adenine1519-N6)-dimethyltransferase